MIVIAQDDKQVRAIVAATLESLGHEVVQADDGDMLLGFYRRHGSRIALFVLEEDLPKYSGLDCFRAIRGDGVATPVIVLTDTLDVELVAQLDDNTFLLCKPFQLSQLEGMARDILGAKEQENNLTCAYPH